ncbi:MAG: succinate dehydrogenase [Parachlamydiales bacterium]|jgi:succinate dehydrogenase / fumarate reductase cytochrome b subunit
MSLLPSDFVWRKLHSLAGIFLVLYVIFHLVTNSQAALWLGEDGKGFIHDVQFIHNLPYLILVEILLLGVPFAIHMGWGVVYAYQARINSYSTDGSTPSLSEYPRNHAFTWQRITSWILLFAIIGHVVHMRIYNYPASALKGDQKYFVQRVSDDPGLYTVAERLGVKVLNAEQVAAQIPAPQVNIPQDTPPEAAILLREQAARQQVAWEEALHQWPLHSGQSLIIAKDFGTATLFMIRDTFKDPLMAVLYSIFVVATCFHTFNGLWTALITWGITLNPPIQQISRYFSVALMLLIMALGLAAVWGTYWLNLRI